MSASIRLSRRKRSSIAAGMTTPTPVKPGFYGIQKPVQFAPNVTPGTYVAPEDEEFDLSALPQDEDSQALFPPSTDPAPAPSRRRVPMHKRRSLGYIPRPPNAFMLFRADFVRQRHVPGTIETNHGSLSKIIGNVWNDLPQEERKVWEHRAKIAKAEHKAKYPDYRFRPVHNKNKKKQKAAAAEAAATSSSRISPTDDSEEARVGEISALLMTGKKGADLAAAVAQLDHEKLLQRQQQHMQFFANNSGALAQPTPSYPQQQGYAPTQFRRRSSSVPVPFFNPGQTFYGFDSHNANESGIALPTLATSFYPGAVGAQQAASNISSPSDLSRPMSALALDAHQMQQMQFAAPAPVHGDPNAFLQPWSMPFNSRMSISNPQTILGLGLRRASSTSAIQNVANNNQQFQFANYARNWEFNYGGNQMDGGMGLQRDDSPLPEVNNSLFDPSFQLNGSTTNTVVESPPQAYEPYASPLEQHPHGHTRSRSQTHMEPIAPHQVDTTMQYQQQAMSASASPASSVTLPELDQFSWMSPLDPNAVAGGEAVEVSIHAPAASMNGGFATMESYGQSQQQQQMWQWQGFGDAGMKGDGVHIDSFFPNNDGFNPSAVEIEAYM